MVPMVSSAADSCHVLSVLGHDSKSFYRDRRGMKIQVVSDHRYVYLNMYSCFSK